MPCSSSRRFAPFAEDLAQDVPKGQSRDLKAKVLLKPHVNPAPGHREIWIQDPDGYLVVFASQDAEAR